MSTKEFLAWFDVGICLVIASLVILLPWLLAEVCDWLPDRWGALQDGFWIMALGFAFLLAAHVVWIVALYRSGAGA